MAYRATRTEGRVNAGNTWTRDLSKGQVFEVGDGRTQVPQEVADYLEEQGLLVECADGSTDNPWFDSDDPELASAGDPKAASKTTTTSKASEKS
jgi:hypothetical protein